MIVASNNGTDRIRQTVYFCKAPKHMPEVFTCCVFISSILSKASNSACVYSNILMNTVVGRKVINIFF